MKEVLRVLDSHAIHHNFYYVWLKFEADKLECTEDYYLVESTTDHITCRLLFLNTKEWIVF